MLKIAGKNPPLKITPYNNSKTFFKIASYLLKGRVANAQKLSGILKGFGRPLMCGAQKHTFSIKPEEDWWLIILFSYLLAYNTSYAHCC
jgi:hypothetical protein